MKVEMLKCTPQPEHLIALAYAICTGKDTIPLENIQKWIKLGHLSPIEHASASFLVSGISRACSHQLVRHRICSFSQQSMRYVTMNKYHPFVMPESVKKEYYLKIKGTNLVRLAQEFYQECIGKGIKPEDARMFLPIATETKMIISANFRQWRHVIELRCEKHAQWEIRQVCKFILVFLNKHAPNVFCDLKERFLDD